jgi:hypothetical protein
LAGVNVYTRSDPSGPLRQCEILCDIRQVAPLPGASWSASPSVEIIRHPYAVVLSQGCDLTQDFDSRSSQNIDPNLTLPCVTLCEAALASDYRQRPKMGNIWKQLRQNDLTRYHFLCKILPSQDAMDTGIESLVLDFKRHFTLATADVYSQLGLGAQRRSVLQCRYLEHLSTRFFCFQARVAIPQPHAVLEELPPQANDLGVPQEQGP